MSRTTLMWNESFLNGLCSRRKGPACPARSPPTAPPDSRVRRTPTRGPARADQLPPCPSCSEDYTHESGALLTCPMCGHEWSPVDGHDISAKVPREGNMYLKSSVVKKA